MVAARSRAVKTNAPTRHPSFLTRHSIRAEPHEQPSPLKDPILFRNDPSQVEAIRKAAERNEVEALMVYHLAPSDESLPHSLPLTQQKTR
jgi:hypothetical protein